MKQLLVSFARYEYWANERLWSVVATLSDEQQQQVIAGSFPSVFKTFLHIWDANIIWWQRVQKVEEIMVPSLSFHPTMEEVANGLLQSNQQWIDWIQQASDAEIETVLSYKNLKGEPFAQPVRDILLHLPNHGSYHRGQVVTMLRQLGVQQIPQLDYILFSRV